MNKALLTLAAGLSLTSASFAQFSPNCLTNQIDISSGYNYAAAAMYPSSPSPGAPVMDHYWQISSMPATSTGITAPKCAERFLTSLVGSWPNSAACSYIGVVANAHSSNSAQLSPIGNFFWNCPPATPYHPTLPPTIFTRSFYIQSTNPSELIDVTIPKFWGDDYAEIYLDNNTAMPIFYNPSVSATPGVTVGTVTFSVAPGPHTIDVRLWDVSGQGSGIKVDGFIRAYNPVLVSNSCYGISDAKCNVIPPPQCNANFTAQVALSTGTGAGIPDKSIQLTLDNYNASSSYGVDYGDGSGLMPYSPAPAFHTYNGPGSYTVCVTETTKADAQCKTCYSFCIGDAFGNASKPSAPAQNTGGVNTLTRVPVNVTISPNPAQSSAEVLLETQADDQVRILVIDAIGKTVANVFTGFMEKGKRSFSINTSHFTSGLYQVKVIVGNNASTHKLSVIK